VFGEKFVRTGGADITGKTEKKVGLNGGGGGRGGGSGRSREVAVEKREKSCRRDLSGKTRKAWK